MRTELRSASVVHVRKHRHDVYIGRECKEFPASKWGNPFVLGIDGTRDEVIEKYKDWIRTQPELMAALPELRDKVLGCWCRPAACHGDVLARLAGGDL